MTQTSNNQQIINSSTITIDNTKPNATIVTPVNNTLLNGSFDISAAVNDSASGVLNVSFTFARPGFASSIINASLVTGTFREGVWNATFNGSTLANAIYNITVNATDFAGNQRIANTTSIVINNSGRLFVALISPTQLSRNIVQNRSLPANASVTCLGGYCQEVNITIYYNLTGFFPETRLNATVGDKPFYNASGFINQTCGYLNVGAVCTANWSINATGLIGSSAYFTINFTSNNSEISQNGTSLFQINITNPGRS